MSYSLGQRYEYATAGLGSAETPTPLSVRVIQRGLIVAGTQPSPGTPDNSWGPATRASLREFIASTPLGVDNARALAALPPGTPTGAREITLPNAIASRLEQLSGRYVVPTSLLTPGTPADSVAEPGGEPIVGYTTVWDWLPWTLGGVALLGIGGFFIYRGRKKKVKANRRRRSTRHRHGRRHTRRRRR